MLQVHATVTHRVTEVLRHGFPNPKFYHGGARGDLKKAAEFLNPEGEPIHVVVGGGDMMSFTETELTEFLSSLGQNHAITLEVSQCHLDLPKLKSALIRSKASVEVLVGMVNFSEPSISKYLSSAKDLRSLGYLVNPCVHIGTASPDDAIYLSYKDSESVVQVRTLPSASKTSKESWVAAYQEGKTAHAFHYSAQAARVVGHCGNYPVVLHYDAVNNTYSDGLDSERFRCLEGVDAQVAVEHLTVADDPELATLSYRRTASVDTILEVATECLGTLSTSLAV